MWKSLTHGARNSLLRTPMYQKNVSGSGGVTTTLLRGTGKQWLITQRPAASVFPMKFLFDWHVSANDADKNEHVRKHRVSTGLPHVVSKVI